MIARAGLVAAALAVPAAAEAQTLVLAVPAGRLGDAVLALGRAAPISVTVPDPGLWRVRVPALKGRMTVRQALARLARVAGARAEPIGPGAWRLVRTGPEARPIGPARRAAPPPPTADRGPDIVVTASKRDLTRDRLAAQLSRVDGPTLAFGGVGGTDRLVARVASLSSTYLGSGRNKLFIRGIADSSFTGPTQATVGQYLGDLRLSYSAPDPDLRLSDLEAVEILEGPQGTLYGSGSLGGIVRLVPRAPAPDRVEASATIGGAATAHGAGSRDTGAVLNLPIAPGRLAVRVVADASDEGGYIDKPAIGRRDVNRTRIGGGRAALRWIAADAWTVDLIGLAQRTRGRDSQYADRDAPPLTRAAPVGEGFAADYAQAQLVATGRIGAVRLRSSTGWARQSLAERYDATGAGEAPRLFAQANRTRMIANETRVWRTRDDGAGWLAGLSYTGNRTRLSRSLGRPEALAPVTGVVNRVGELTLYGEGSVALRPGLLATAGGRVTRSSLGGEGEDVAPAIASARAGVVADRLETAFLPSASLNAAILPDISLYLRYQQGFRPGGLAIEGDFVRRFRNDRVATLEGGVRHGRPGAGRFDLAASIAYTRWRDIQADFIDGFGLPSTANIGNGRIWTAGVVAGAALPGALRLEGALLYNDSRVTQPATGLARLFPGTAPLSAFDRAGGLVPGAVTASQLLALRGRQVPNIAGVTARAGIGWNRRLAAGTTLKADAWVRYVGGSRLGIGPVLGEEQGDYLDSAATVRVGRPGLGITLGITNLTDAVGNRFALGTPLAVGRGQVTPLRPRTVRISLDTAF